MPVQYYSCATTFFRGDKMLGRWRTYAQNSIFCCCIEFAPDEIRREKENYGLKNCLLDAFKKYRGNVLLTPTLLFYLKCWSIFWSHYPWKIHQTSEKNQNCARFSLLMVKRVCTAADFIPKPDRKKVVERKMISFQFSRYNFEEKNFIVSLLFEVILEKNH